MIKKTLAMILIAGSMFAFAGDGETMDVKGEIVDMSCYVSHGARGEKHAKCAMGCAKKGLPIGVLTESGDLYLIIENHDNADAYAAAKEKAASTVTVQGTVFEKNGMKAIQVAAIIE